MQQHASVIKKKSIIKNSVCRKLPQRRPTRSAGPGFSQRAPRQSPASDPRLHSDCGAKKAQTQAIAAPHSRILGRQPGSGKPRQIRFPGEQTRVGGAAPRAELGSGPASGQLRGMAGLGAARSLIIILTRTLNNAALIFFS